MCTAELNKWFSNCIPEKIALEKYWENESNLYKEFETNKIIAYGLFSEI